MKKGDIKICPKCREKQITASLTIIDFSHEEFAFDNVPVNALENDNTKINCCVYCNTSFFGSSEGKIVD